MALFCVYFFNLTTTVLQMWTNAKPSPPARLSLPATTLPAHTRASALKVIWATASNANVSCTMLHSTKIFAYVISIQVVRSHRDIWVTLSHNASFDENMNFFLMANKLRISFQNALVFLASFIETFVLPCHSRNRKNNSEGCVNPLPPSPIFLTRFRQAIRTVKFFNQTRWACPDYVNNAKSCSTSRLAKQFIHLLPIRRSNFRIQYRSRVKNFAHTFFRTSLFLKANFQLVV